MNNFSLTSIPDGKEIKAGEILDKPTLLLIVRRPGCVLCREQAGKLLAFRKEIREVCGVNMVAVFKESVGVDEFSPLYWRDAMYLDKEMEFYKYLGKGKKNVASVLSLAKPAVLSAGWRATSDGFSGNFVGEGMYFWGLSRILGGLLVVNGNGEVVYEYAEKFFGDHSPLENVLEACFSLTSVATRAEYDPLQMVASAKENGRLKFSRCDADVCQL